MSAPHRLHPPLRYPVLITTLSVLAILTIVAPNSTADDASQQVRFHGLRPTDPGGRVGLRNPGRGWRIETIIAEPRGAGAFGPSRHVKDKVPPGFDDEWWIRDAQSFEPFGLTLTQAYCYLTDFKTRPISQAKLDLLQKSLDEHRRCGLKTLLRFAYEKGYAKNKTDGPTPEWILRHMDQLAPIILRNTDVIYVLQAGFVGAWGEWHHAANIEHDDFKTKADIIKKLLEILPENRCTQIRYPKIKRLTLSQPVLNVFKVLDAQTSHSAAPTARIGYHNDGFLAGPTDGWTWPEKPHFANPGNPEFDGMTKESPFVPVDGELFWADKAWDGKAPEKKGVDGLNAALRLRLHHYSSFSLAHSYSPREGKNCSMDRWAATPIDVEELRQAKMPISDGYFQNAFGKPVMRTRFEYIQDHLGYRIELQQARFPKTLKPGGKLDVEISLVNRGFSTLHNPRPVLLVLIDANHKVIELPVADADPRRWQPYTPGDTDYKPLLHTIRYNATLPASVGRGPYRLGLWMPDADKHIRLNSRYAVRVANRDTVWWTDAKGHYGINLIGVVK